MEKDSVRERTQYKFGILYMKPGQEKNEDLLYSNRTMFSHPCYMQDLRETETTSAVYDEFLTLLGDRIELATWDKFMGGLQNGRIYYFYYPFHIFIDRTGKHSIYTQYEGMEIMFHVATMLPFSHAEEQQLDRKRHLGHKIFINFLFSLFILPGNDVVIIVFKEPGAQFDPTVLHSQFTRALVYDNLLVVTFTFYRGIYCGRARDEPGRLTVVQDRRCR